MMFPASKMMDTVIGVDLHTVLIPPSPAPVPMVPHPYLGPVYLWTTPAFPKVDTLINGMPAATSGAMGYFAHVPMGAPVPPTLLNLMYWKRYLLNIPMSLLLVALTLMANLAIAGISALFVPADSAAGRFIKDVTGVDTSSWSGAWGSIKANLSSYTQWSTWIKLLMPPVPYPGGQGSVAVGSPNVQINGGPLAFVAPLMSTSCSELPVVPNAATIGFSNVMVGVSIADMVRGLAVSATQSAVSAGVGAGVSRLRSRRNRTATEGQHT